MPCDTRMRFPGQTISQRAVEVRTAADKLAQRLASGRIKINIDKASGAINFDGWDANERNGITDSCAYRKIMSGTSAAAKMAIARAEQLAGRAVDKKAVAQGIHSHDGGRTWHSHKG